MFHSFLITLALSIFPNSGWAQFAPPYEVIHPLTGSEGAEPQSGLVRGADDRLYGTATIGGGPGAAGTIYRIASNGTFRVIHRFQTASPAGGINPVSLIRGRDKNLYGTTDYGGTLADGSTVDADGNPVGDGVIYRLNWNAARRTYEGVTILHTFDCSNGEGGDPWGSLVEGPDGALYGVTAPSERPDSDCTDPTTIFKINKDGSGFAVLASFQYLVTGAYQFGPLVFGSDGSIFGTLVDSANPALQFGSVFKIAPDGVVSDSPLHVFGWADGAYPFSGLVRGMDGAFYGTTYAGGAGGVGTLFRIDESGNFRSLYSFDPTSIHTPYSPLVIGGDGKIYGAAHAGG